MQPVKSISASLHYAARLICVLGLTIPVAFGALLFLAILGAGLLLFPLVGSSAWDPAFNIGRDAGPPQLEGVALLVGAFFLLLVIAGFGYWCVNWARASSGSSRLVFRTVRRLLLAAAALIEVPDNPAGRQFIPTGSNPLTAFPHRVTRFTPAGLTGATPHLE